MKFTSLVLIVSFLLVATVSGEEKVEEDNFKGEFFQGMETGFFMREAKDGHHEYECPDPSLSNEIFNKVTTVFGPVQMLLNMAKNEKLNLGLRMLDTLLKNVFGLISAIEGYRGSEFCSGILFGVAGSNLVLKLGRDIMELID